MWDPSGSWTVFVGHCSCVIIVIGGVFDNLKTYARKKNFVVSASYLTIAFLQVTEVGGIGMIIHLVSELVWCRWLRRDKKWDCYKTYETFNSYIQSHKKGNRL